MNKNEALVGMKVISIHPASKEIMDMKGLKFITFLGETVSGHPVTDLDKAGARTKDGIEGYSHDWKSLIPFRPEQTIYIRIKD